MKKDGFTLIELLITFVILGIMASIAIPGFARWMPGYRLKSATRDLYSNLQLAKMGAVRDNGEWAVLFNAGGGSYQVISGGADRDYSTAGDNTIEKTITLSDYESGVSYGQGTVTIPIDASRPLGDSVTFDDRFDGNDVIVFNSRGMINEQGKSGGEAYISNSNNSTYAVVCLATGASDIAGASLNSADTGRKTFYSPDVSYFGNCWTSKPVLYFGTGDRAHPRYAMISNRFYTVADHNTLTDETDLLNLTCDELDENADSDGDGDVDSDDTTRKQDLISKLSNESVSRGFFRVIDKQGDCTQSSISHVGEKILSRPTLFFKNVYFTAYQPVFDDPCNPNGNAFIYALDYCLGKSVFNYSEETGPEVRNIEDTYQIIQNSSIPSGVRVITRGGHAAGLISAGGAVSGVGEDLTTNIPGPPGGVSQILWETD